ncbi:MAG: RIP metalloprotease RseP [Candidatus Omnitrophota bacterium]
MHFLVSLLPTVVVLGVLILIHELGHFIACRLTRVKVEKFSIGFGPEIFHWQGKETRYAVSLLPLGGFVKPAGESIGEIEGGTPKGGDFLAAPLGARIGIVLAGVLMNYALAIVLFTVVFLMGRPVPGTTVGGFVDGYPALESGLQAGDKIISVDRVPVTRWDELTSAIQRSSHQAMILEVVRKGGAAEASHLFLSIHPKIENAKDIFGKEEVVRRLGIIPHPEANVFEQYPFPQAFSRGLGTSVNLAVMTHKALFYLLIGRLSIKSVAGPVGIVTLTGNAAQLGLTYVLQLTATLSVSLAVINLLPIPALDGGHLFFLLIEGIRRKRVSLEFQERASQIGFALLMAFMVFVIYNDLVNLGFFSKIARFFSL